MVSFKDILYFYYVVGNLVNGSDFDIVLIYYEDLLSKGFINVYMEYFVIDFKIGELVVFGSKEERDNMVKFVDYINFIE